MFHAWTLLMLLCLQCGQLCSALGVLDVEVSPGEFAALYCESLNFNHTEVHLRWDVRGKGVMVELGETTLVSHRFKGRLHLPSEDQIREGIWSVIILHTRLSDQDVYECIGDDTVLSIVNLTVVDPDETSTLGSWNDTDDLVEIKPTVTSLPPELLEVSTQPTEAETESQPVEVFEVEEAWFTDRDDTKSEIEEVFEEEEKTSFPERNNPEMAADSPQFPWILVGLVGGVLLVTSVVLCVLRALQHI